MNFFEDNREQKRELFNSSKMQRILTEDQIDETDFTSDIRKSVQSPELRESGWVFKGKKQCQDI